MISQYDVRRLFEKKWNADDSIPCTLDEDTVYMKNGTTMSLEAFTIHLRILNDCDFESIYECPGTLLNVLRCRQCGTVIFASNDVEDYDDNLKCPTCSDYETWFEHWTKEDTDSDERKQNTIKMYEEFAEEETKRYERYQRRKKHDDEIFVHRHRGKKYFVYVALKCNNLFHTFLKGLHFKIEIGEKETEDDIGYTMKNFIEIPLSWSRFYLFHIYPYTKGCHPDFRKYFPWQKKSETKGE